MAKSRDAFRTISEVSDALDTPTHVLRFWESKFTQIKPVKRAGGRRYYRPEDIDLLAGIKTRLHDQGLTIKGAQKLMREQGVKHVISLVEVAEATNEVDAVAPEPAPETKSAPVEDTIVAPEITATDAEESPKPLQAAPPAKAADRAMALAAAAEANLVFVHRNKAKITPLLTRLQALRDAMRAA